jgi:hypothetical protein
LYQGQKIGQKTTQKLPTKYLRAALLNGMVIPVGEASIFCLISKTTKYYKKSASYSQKQI